MSINFHQVRQCVACGNKEGAARFTQSDDGRELCSVLLETQAVIWYVFSVICGLRS